MQHFLRVVRSSSSSLCRTLRTDCCNTGAGRASKLPENILFSFGKGALVRHSKRACPYASFINLQDVNGPKTGIAQNVMSSKLRSSRLPCFGMACGAAGSLTRPVILQSLSLLSQGALGCGCTDDNYVMEEVHVPKDIIGVAAGHYHSLAWTAGGELFSWG
jgi:hypothetical protein